MQQKLVSVFDLGIISAAAARAPSPDRSDTLTDNRIYDLLFCDNPAPFKPENGRTPAAWQTALFAVNPDADAIRAIAEDEAAESRVRLLAFNWLRDHDHPVPPGHLLGVIVEAPVEGGVDVLAAYHDGQVRYINHTGKTSFYERPPANVAAGAKAVLDCAVQAVNGTSPVSTKRPPPSMHDLRITLLAADGLYCGQGPYDVMLDDPLAGPIFDKAAALLLLAVDTAIEHRTTPGRRH